MFSSIKRLFRSHSDFRNVRVQLLSRDECHLCDIALGELERLRRNYWFPLEIIKIEPGDEWYPKYHEKIPVVLIEGRMAFKYRVERAALLERLKAAARQKGR
jgi:hypothetical protein